MKAACDDLVRFKFVSANVSEYYLLKNGKIICMKYGTLDNVIYAKKIFVYDRYIIYADKIKAIKNNSMYDNYFMKMIEREELMPDYFYITCRSLSIIRRIWSKRQYTFIFFCIYSHLSISDGGVDFIKIVLDEYVLEKQLDEDQIKMLHNYIFDQACLFNKIEIVHYVYQTSKYLDIDFTNTRGKYIFFNACLYGITNVVEFLFKTFDIKNKHPELFSYAIEIAIKKNHYQMLKLFHEIGATKSQISQFTSDAIHKCEAETVIFLMDIGFAFNQLHTGEINVDEIDIDLVFYLMKNNLISKKISYTMLYEICHNHKPEFLEYVFNGNLVDNCLKIMINNELVKFAKSNINFFKIFMKDKKICDLNYSDGVYNLDVVKFILKENPAVCNINRIVTSEINAKNFTVVKWIAENVRYTLCISKCEIFVLCYYDKCEILEELWKRNRLCVDEDGLVMAMNYANLNTIKWFQSKGYQTEHLWSKVNYDTVIDIIAMKDNIAFLRNFVGQFSKIQKELIIIRSAKHNSFHVFCYLSEITVIPDDDVPRIVKNFIRYNNIVYYKGSNAAKLVKYSIENIHLILREKSYAIIIFLINCYGCRITDEDIFEKNAGSLPLELINDLVFNNIISKEHLNGNIIKILKKSLASKYNNIFPLCHYCNINTSNLEIDEEEMITIINSGNHNIILFSLKFVTKAAIMSKQVRHYVLQFLKSNNFGFIKTPLYETFFRTADLTEEENAILNDPQNNC